MSRQAMAAACLSAAASLLVVAGPVVRPARRLRRLASTPRRGRPSWWPDRVRWGAGLAGVAVAVVVGGWAGLVAGPLAGVVADRLLRRIEPRAVRDRRLRETADLPLAADLLAAALRAGAPVDRSALAVAEALGGPLADRLGRVGRTLGLGGTAIEAWEHLRPVPGAGSLVAAAVRSSNSGAALAGALTRLADDLRAERSTAAEATARRAGVLIVLPLGLCFLPAFILAGLVPVIVAVLGDVL
ncbi:type II secretion system F family protein [Micromonospora sp. WMMD1128]|uniref:type II secretion system F family protein n=1 Tax=unclassified Micromonospora TaxID=2617518 RepID=UPI00248CC6FE|nr:MULTISPECIES: type II secretion system F family protein [unclassified Micromonospora]WBB73280.1 type II secretion system F family protein [Micromonospora sp. WMMD1128]WFE33320.1 type II secretion system F family protein [Micromonospora sp. WMMD975]